MTSGQETEWVYSYNPGACTGLELRIMEVQLYDMQSSTQIIISNKPIPTYHSVNIPSKLPAT